MPSIWNILGLDGPTHDLKVIKRAYSAKLKITRPDDDPQGFMALREAFDAAKNYAAYQAADPYETESPPKTSTPPQVDFDHDTSEPSIEEPEPHPELTLLSQIDDILQSPQARNDTETWHPILDAALELSIDEYGVFEHNFRYQLIDAFEGHNAEAAPPRRFGVFKSKPVVFMSESVGHSIFSAMGWTDTTHTLSHIRGELTWLQYEFGLLTRPKEPKIKPHNWLYDARRLSFHILTTLLAALLVYFVDVKDVLTDKNPTLTLPAAGQATYGGYAVDSQNRSWSYRLNHTNPDIRALKPGDQLSDTFQAEMQNGDIIIVTIDIKGTDGKPELSNTQSAKSKPMGFAGWMTLLAYFILGVTASLLFWAAFEIASKYIKRAWRKFKT